MIPSEHVRDLELRRASAHQPEHREHRIASTTAVAAVIYTFAPIDLIPELVLGPLGFADDISLWTIFAVLFLREQRRWQSGLESRQPS